MQNVKSLSLAIACLLLTLPHFNCGGSSANPLEPQSSASDETPAPSAVATPLDSTIQFRIVQESTEDNSHPDPGRSLETTTELDDTVLEGNQLLFLNNLSLPNPDSPFANIRKELFLVWPDQLSGSTIRNATYTHRALDHDLKRIPSSGVGPFPAWHDSKNNRWYIPLSEIFKKSETYTTDAVELGHIQEIHLDFVPQLGANQSFEIRFHILPPLPNLKLQTVTLAPVPPPPTLVPEFVSQGWIIQSEAITNPAPKVLHLWVKAGAAPGDLKMRTYLDATLHAGADQAKISSVRQFNFTNRVSTGDATLQSVKAIHQDGTQQLLSFKAGEWLLLPLHPNETLRLDWIAGPAPGTPIFNLPAPDHETYTYRIIDSERQNSIDPQCRFHTFTKEKTVHYQYNWGYVGGELVGTWQRQIRIAHDFTQREFAVGVPGQEGSGLAFHSQEVRNESISTHVKHGELHPLSWPHPQQGIFR